MKNENRPFLDQIGVTICHVFATFVLSAARMVRTAFAASGVVAGLSAARAAPGGSRRSHLAGRSLVMAHDAGHTSTVTVVNAKLVMRLSRAHKSIRVIKSRIVIESNSRAPSRPAPRAPRTVTPALVAAEAASAPDLEKHGERVSMTRAVLTTKIGEPKV